jgi:hypothetical protein
MKKKSINFRDPIVEQVVDKFVERSDVGFKKYGVTLQEEDAKGIKTLYDYLNDTQEELMDAILYLQTAKASMRRLMHQLENEKTI